MIPRRCLMLIPAAALLACAGGTTMRVAQDDNPGGDGVSLAPAPAQPIDSAVRDTIAVPQAQLSPRAEQGYAAYGEGAKLEVRRIGQWTRTGVSESRRLIIRDMNAWAAFWSELGAGEPPAVDFSRDVAIAVAAGQRPSGGYGISIEGVHQHQGDLTVEVLEVAPGPNCMTAAALTQPVDVVVVPSVGIRGWTFLERREVRGCR
jgi:hypothetical protein